ncbi:MAG TPA: VOC family protein [Actinomycetota bacterium]
MAGELVYFTLGVENSEQARAFYGGLFGWQFEPGSVADGFYIQGSSPPGGLQGGGSTRGFRVYFQVDDIEAAAARIRDLGGDAGMVKTSSSGSYADCRDNEGHEFSLFAPPR